MNKLFQTLMLLLLAQRAPAQADSFQPIRRLSADVADVAVDNLDNLYVVSSTDQIKKYNGNGDSVSVYNGVKRFGKLHSFDVTNPLKPLLFYKDFATVVVLDRLLTLRAALDLRRLNIIQTSAVGLSYDGNIWLFDEYENRLKKLDEGGTVLLQTTDLRAVFETPILPQQIIDQAGTVYLYDGAQGLFLFDYYGAFKKKLPITGWQHVVVRDGHITGIKGNSLQFFNTTTMLSGARTLPAAPATGNRFIANNKLFFWTDSSLHIYNYPQ